MCKHEDPELKRLEEELLRVNRAANRAYFRGQMHWLDGELGQAQIQLDLLDTLDKRAVQLEAELHIAIEKRVMPPAPPVLTYIGRP